MPNPQSESEWVNTALQQHLNLLSAQVGTEIGRNEVNIQKSGHYPTLGLQASKRDSDNNSLRADSGSPFAPADTENISEGVGLQLNIPIYSGGQTSSRVRQAVAQHRSAKEKLEKAADKKMKGGKMKAFVQKKAKVIQKQHQQDIKVAKEKMKEKE